MYFKVFLINLAFLTSVFLDKEDGLKTKRPKPNSDVSVEILPSSGGRCFVMPPSTAAMIKPQPVYTMQFSTDVENTFAKLNQLSGQNQSFTQDGTRPTAALSGVRDIGPVSALPESSCVVVNRQYDFALTSGHIVSNEADRTSALYARRMLPSEIGNVPMSVLSASGRSALKDADQNFVAGKVALHNEKLSVNHMNSEDIPQGDIVRQKISPILRTSGDVPMSPGISLSNIVALTSRAVPIMSTLAPVCDLKSPRLAPAAIPFQLFQAASGNGLHRMPDQSVQAPVQLVQLPIQTMQMAGKAVSQLHGRILAASSGESAGQMLSVDSPGIYIRSPHPVQCVVPSLFFSLPISSSSQMTSAAPPHPFSPTLQSLCSDSGRQSLGLSPEKTPKDSAAPSSSSLLFLPSQSSLSSLLNRETLESSRSPLLIASTLLPNGLR